MALIWMEHPDHGMKDVYVEEEARENEKNGWKRVDRNAQEEQKKQEEKRERQKRE